MCLFIQQTFSESGTVNDISLFSLQKLTNSTLKRHVAMHTLNSRAIFKTQRENINRVNNIKILLGFLKVKPEKSTRDRLKSREQ